ncbi:MAG: hypothetical protein FWG50_12430 [Kiritimatiellaeota bacterium]|nr:hypothetical protein [Kiritimatiellota bacterium]
MKRVFAGMAVFALMATDSSATRGMGVWERFERFPEEEVERLREEFKDAGKLERYIKELLWRDNFMGDVPPRFKRKFNVSDEVMRAALMSLIRDCSAKVGWQDDETPKTGELLWTRAVLGAAILWLGACTDAETKQFLMGIAADGTQRKWYRSNAVKAYLYHADAQETRDTLARFLIKREAEIYVHFLAAIRVYDESEDDPQKREVIIASLIVALAQEENRGFFAMMDKNLAERNKEYATSHQRLAMVQRMSKLPPTNWYGDSEKALDPALKSFRFRFFKTNVSTNLTELMSRDFTQPPVKPKP